MAEVESYRLLKLYYICKQFNQFTNFHCYTNYAQFYLLPDDRRLISFGEMSDFLYVFITFN